MAKQYVFSGRDRRRNETMLRWFDRNENRRPIPGRRRPVMAAASSRRTRIGYCITNAGTGSTIQCYLDEREPLLPDVYSTGEKIVNAKVLPAIPNSFVYNCKIAGTAVAEPTWPTTIGSIIEDGSVVWECINQLEEITVNCRIFAEENLDATIPLLCINDPIFIEKFSIEWWCLWPFNGFIEHS